MLPPDCDKLAAEFAQKAKAELLEFPENGHGRITVELDLQSGHVSHWGVETRKTIKEPHKR